MGRGDQEPLARQVLWGLLGLAAVLAIVFPLVTVGLKVQDSFVLPIRQQLLSDLLRALPAGGYARDAIAAFLVLDVPLMLLGVLLAAGYRYSRPKKVSVWAVVSAAVFVLGARMWHWQWAELVPDSSLLLYQQLSIGSLAVVALLTWWLLSSTSSP